MKSEAPESPADRLLDELLREQAHGPDELWLQRIEAAVDARSQPVAARRPAAGSPRWLAIAAGIVLVGGAWMLWPSSAPSAAAPGMSHAPSPAEAPTSVKKQPEKSLVGQPNRNRLAPRDAATGQPDERLTRQSHLPVPDPFRAMTGMPSLVADNARGGALTGTGKLLARLPAESVDERTAFVELASQAPGAGSYGHPTPAMIPPKRAHSKKP